MEIVGAVASILGLFVGLFGFAWTIRGVRKSTAAASAASAAAIETKDRLRKFDLVSELSGAVEEMRSILRMHRMPGEKQWLVLVDRYGYLKARLIGILATWVEMSERDRTQVVGTIAHLATIERRVDDHLTRGGLAPNVAEINSILNEQLDRLLALQATAKTGIGA